MGAMKRALAATPGMAAHRRLSRHRQNLALVLAVFAVVCVSRVAVFPASIWEQDEAYFAAAVVEIDIADSAPHPPFFPLWIGIGKALTPLGLEPAMSLQVASAVLSVWMFLPLVVLWSRFMKPAPAIAAAALGLAAPGVWLLSGRAFSGTAATAALVTALAFWTMPNTDRRWLSAGSVAAGFAILIRPQFAVAVVAVIVVMLPRVERPRRLALIAPVVVVAAAGAAAFVVAAGGGEAVVAAVSRHAALHFGTLPDASRGLLDSGLARALCHPIVLIGWCVLTVWGAAVVLRSSARRGAGCPVVAALVSIVILVFGLSNPAHPRYAVPLVVLSCGFVVVGLGRLLNERWTLVSVAAAVIGAAAAVLPVAGTYRNQSSPPLRALAEADRLADQRRGVVVIDRSLHSFAVFREATGITSAPTLFDHVLEFGTSPPPPPSRTVLVFDGDHDALLVAGESRRTFSCAEGLLRRLSQGRFLDVTVADGAALENRSGSDGPFVILE